MTINLRQCAHTNHVFNTATVTLAYLLTHEGATQVGDYLTAVCDYNRAGHVMIKQLTNFIQQPFTDKDVLESNHGNSIITDI